MPEAVAASPKGKNVWEELLAKAASVTRVRDMNLLVVGDWGAGKKALVSTLVEEHAKRKWAEDPQAQRTPMQDFVQSRAVSMAGLGYTFMDVKVDDEASAKVGMWVMDDKSRAKKLMLNCLPDAQALQTAAAVIVLDLSEPWKALKTLQAWSELLKDHVAHVAGDLLPDLQDEVEAFTRAAKPSSGEVMRLADLLGSSRADAPPLVQGSLSENIGLPLFVVGTKADKITAAADDIGTELKLEFIQRHIRQFCLKHGASLTYTSSKLGQNCSLFFDYMLHRMFPTIVALPNQTGGVEQEPQDDKRPSPIISIRDGVHVPAGWDHQQLIDALANTSNQRFAAWTSLAFEDVIVEPSKQSTTQDEMNEDEDVALPYQEFLRSLLKKQKALPSSSHKPFGNVSAAAVKGFDETASSFQLKAAQETGSSERRKAPASPKRPAVTQTSSARRGVTVQDATENPDKVRDFFSSLLKGDK